MAENIQNESNVVNSTANLAEDQSFTFQDLIGMLISKWRWFLLSVALCGCVGVLYLLHTSPVYQRNATILVKDSRKGSGMAEMAAFSDLAGFAQRRNVDNELFVLQARRLMLQVVNKLGLTVNYTTRSGLRTVDLYHRSPIVVNFVNNNEEDAGCSFRVKLNANGYSLSEFHRHDSKGDAIDVDEAYTVKAKFGDQINTPYGAIIIDKTLYMEDEFVGKTISVSKVRKEALATRYCSATKSSLANKLSSIINISLNDVSPRRAEDVINTLIEVYNEDAVFDKQQVAEATAEFIDDRLAIISKELGAVDNDIREFKKRNSMTTIEDDVKRDMTESTKLKSEGLSVDSQIEMAKFIKEYLNDPSKEYSLIPITNVGDSSNSLADQIKDYNEIILRREKLLINGSIKNPVVSQLDADRVAVKNAILESIESTIATLDIKRANVRKEERKTNARISSVPVQEQEFLSIARQQRIKEELYLYLLNKREENAISLAITENTARIIDSAYGPMNPVAPRRMFVLLIALVMGFALPFLAFYMYDTLDTSVRGRHDIEKYTKVPYLGDVPLSTNHVSNGIAVKENGRDSVSEAFRIIRTNMGFMNTGETRQQVIQVSSSNAHAGKTFVSTNLGMTLAFSGNKVLLVDIDLRRRTLSKHMGQRNNPMGVTKYLSDKSTNISDIITKSGLHENFDCIYAGLQPPNPAEMLLSSRLEELIDECRKKYDYIILDSVPAMVIADALISSRVADLSIYVVREGLLDRRQLPDIDALYAEQKLKNMCIILNGTTEKSHRYGYGYGYGYRYAYTYSYDNDEETVDTSRLGKLCRKLGITRFTGKHHHHHHHHKA